MATTLTYSYNTEIFSTTPGSLINPSTSAYQLFFISFGITQSIVVIIVNPMTIFALFKSRMVKKSKAYIFIINHCLVDLCLGLLHVLRFTGQILHWLEKYSTTSIALSWLASSVGCFLFLCSVSAALVMGVERAVATCKPMSYKHIVTHRASTIALLVTWVGNSLVNFPAMLYQFAEVYSSGELHYVINPTEVYPAYYTTYFSGPLMMSFIGSNVVLYSFVLGCYLRTVAKVNTVSNSEQRTRRITRTCMVTVAMLIFGMIPILVVGAIPPEGVASDKTELYQFLYDISLMFCIIPSYLNNIMYACLQKDVREAYVRLFKAGISQVQPSGSNRHNTENSRT